MTQPCKAKFRPMFAYSAGLCTCTLILFLTSCITIYELSHRHGDNQIFWLIPVFFALLHIIFVVLSIWKWNAWVYLYEDFMVQYQWGRNIIIPYDKIRTLQFRKPQHPYPATIAISFVNVTIVFDCTKLEIFRQYCTNDEVNSELDKWSSQPHYTSYHYYCSEKTLSDPFIAQKVKALLVTVHGIDIYEVTAAYMGFNRSCDVYLYFKTDAQLQALTSAEKEKIQTIYADYLKEHGFMPNEIETIRFYFDSDENVQKNYAGSYFYATR